MKIYKYANVGNHLHAVIKLHKRHLWGAFIRELTSKLVEILGIKGYWKHRPFTRIIRGWQKAYKTACEYVYLNILESEGRIDRKETKTLKELRAIFDG